MKISTKANTASRGPAGNKNHLTKDLSQRTKALLQAHSLPSSRSARFGVGGRIQKLDYEDINVGNLLGEGGFSNVYEIASFRRGSFTQPDIPTGSEERMGNFVVKHLRPSLMDDGEEFRLAAVDLAAEAKILSNLNHENIVKLHGVTKGCVISAFSSASEGGYFLVLDKLQCTLDVRIKTWCEEGIQVKKGLKLIFNRKKNRQWQEFLLARLQIACQVAQGLEYLHSQHIMYRDIKPQNIGLDEANKVKIFDFGLARMLLPDDTKKPTGLTGTLRYMAPEVAKCKAYGLSVDVYSYSLLLWEMCALKAPFWKYKYQELQEKVIYGGKRPKIDAVWPEAIQSLLRDCWSDDPAERPGFENVLIVLREEINMMLD